MVVNKNKNRLPEENATSVCTTQLESAGLSLLELAENTQKEMVDYYPRMLEENCPEDVQAKAESLKRATVAISKAHALSYKISDEFNARWNDIKRQKKKKKIPISVPANAEIDLNESRLDHFAKGLNFYKILLICFVGSFLGVVVELLWCLITHGYIESRSGLVYGPFNLLYGVGAAVLTVCLYKYRNRSAYISFAGSMLVGSAVEYVCSFGQELVFGSRSWDYSDMPFNLNGRICLMYSVFWGVLGIFWIKTVYPFMAKWILKLPNRAGKIITWALVVFFVFNSFMTVFSMTRWTQRISGIEPHNAFEAFFDERFPDERMKKVFANMEFLQNNE